jgi:hypothetical protein
MNIEINTEKKPSISKRMFTLIRDVPGLNEEQVHEFMSKDMKYKTGSGKSLLYRMIRCKYIRKDKNGILHAHIDEYKAMPPFVKKKKKAVKVESGLAAAAKIKQDQAVKFREAALNAATMAGAFVKRPVIEQPAKKDFLRELGQRISSYFRP